MMFMLDELSSIFFIVQAKISPVVLILWEVNESYDVLASSIMDPLLVLQWCIGGPLYVFPLLNRLVYLVIEANKGEAL